MTRRRVIFPEADFWTRPRAKDTTMTNPAATDCRRATSLVIHYGTEDHEGVNAILQEAAEDKRITEMILSTLSLFQSVIPELHTDLGMACISDALLDLAKDDTADPDARRAARLIAHHGNKNLDGINTCLTEAKQGNAVTLMILAVLHMYATVSPVIFTTMGLAALQRSVIQFAAREEN